MQDFDLTIVGAGIVGLATAMKLSSSHPHLRVAVLEKETTAGAHQTGHNSGVIHSGVYYRPGSLKAGMCLSGAQQLTRFCDEKEVPYEICGKVIVATEPEEIPRLHTLHQRGTANGIPGLRLMKPEEVREIEPHVACIEGLYVPTTGIVDFGQVAKAYAAAFVDGGGKLLFGHKLMAVSNRSDCIVIETSQATLQTRLLVNCAGLYSDRVAELSGMTPPCRIVPFRGEYYKISPEYHYLVKNLIYPVPDPRFPFLGVHFTRMVDGNVEAGPNAVLAWRREGYRKSDFDRRELWETLTYPGFWHLALRYWRPGLDEMARSYSKSRFAQSLRRLVPKIGGNGLLPGGAGVRAQAVSADGSLLDDFVILQKERMVHVLNAPSPAATSSLAIGEYVANMVMSHPL